MEESTRRIVFEESIEPEESPIHVVITGFEWEGPPYWCGITVDVFNLNLRLLSTHTTTYSDWEEVIGSN